MENDRLALYGNAHCPDEQHLRRCARFVDDDHYGPLRVFEGHLTELRDSRALRYTDIYPASTMDAGRARVAQKSGTMVTVEGYGALCPPCLSLQLATRADGDDDPERTLEVCQRAQKVIDCW